LYISREEHRLRVFDERMQQRIFWGTRDEVRGDWRRLHTEELHDMYFSPCILFFFSRRMRWSSHVAHMGDRRSAYRVFVERPEERRPLGRGKSRLEDNTEMHR
jgi:hypothetical protein